MINKAKSESRIFSSWALLVQVLFLACILLVGLHASMGHAQAPDPSRGQMLYENHCRFCHTPKVHERPNKAPLTRAQLRSIVNDWQRQEGLSWTPQDTDEVVEYLVRTRYPRLREDAK
jgi:mono/diheme cytochrome c family protein